MISEKVIARLSLYRRLLNVLKAEGIRSLYSYELARLAGCSAAQVRRDLMVVGYHGTTRKGYEVEGLLTGLREFLDEPGGEGAALVGVGNLGKAILAYFTGRRPNLAFVAAFDTDPAKTGRLIHGCPCHPMDEMAEVVEREDVRMAVLAVPAGAARDAADRLVRAGIRGILSFAPVRLRVPPGVYVEDLDVTTAMEKVAYFARRGAGKEGATT